MTELEAINLMLLTAGEAGVTDLSDPHAQFAKTPLAFAIAELPYDSTDFALNFESLPPIIQTYVLTRATRKFQLSVVGAAEYLVYSEADELLAKKNIIAYRVTPNAVLKSVQDKLKSRFGFAVDPTDTASDFQQYVILQAAFEFQAAWLPSEFYVITPEEIAIAEEDFRVALVASKTLPVSVLDEEANIFISTYGYAPTELTEQIIDHIKLKAAYKAQPVLIRNQERYVLKPQDLDNSEASLVISRILPKPLIADITLIVRDELGLALDAPLTLETIYYIQVKAAEQWQYSVIRYASKMPFSDRDVLVAKAKALNSLGVSSLLESKGVKRIVDRDNLPEITTYAGGVVDTEDVV